MKHSAIMDSPAPVLKSGTLGKTHGALMPYGLNKRKNCAPLEMAFVTVSCPP